MEITEIITITYSTPTGKHTVACSTCGAPVTARIGKVQRVDHRNHREVKTNTCRKCGTSRTYIVRPNLYGGQK